MPEEQFIKNWWTVRYDKNNQIHWRRRDVAIEKISTEETFSLTEEDEAESVECFEVFK